MFLLLGVSENFSFFTFFLFSSLQSRKDLLFSFSSEEKAN
eukprot:UN25829